MSFSFSTLSRLTSVALPGGIISPLTGKTAAVTGCHKAVRLIHVFLLRHSSGASVFPRTPPDTRMQAWIFYLTTNKPYSLSLLPSCFMPPPPSPKTPAYKLWIVRRHQINQGRSTRPLLLFAPASLPFPPQLGRCNTEKLTHRPRPPPQP